MEERWPAPVHRGRRGRGGRLREGRGRRCGRKINLVEICLYLET